MPNTPNNKRFFNARETIVQNALDGLIAAAGADENGNPRLVRLDGYPHIKVVLRGDWKKDRVALISGGGAGHEPAHAGFVGKGMLTAAVSGEIFASPTVDAVLAAICAVTGEAGCLLVVKNYTGDRLNFGLAAERAKQMGYLVEMIIVSDDVAIPDAAQPRGVAGTLFVHKYAGHLAEQGDSLSAIKSKTEAFAKGLFSLGMSVSTCALPGQEFTERLGHAEAELGLGIHGEPGRRRIPMEPAADLMSVLSRQLAEMLPADGTRYALLVNNLGAVPPMEMHLLVNELMASPLMERVDYLFGPGHLMTALNMNGFSLTLAALDPDATAALLSPVGPGAWLAGVRPVREKKHRPLLHSQSPEYAPSSEPGVRAMLLGVEAAIIEAERSLNSLDGKTGDGDAGSTFAAGARAVAAKIDTLPLADPATLTAAIAAILGKSMGGSSGILLSIFLNAAAKSLHDGAALPAALQHGIAQMQFYGGASEGSRTMLDAMIPALRAYAASGSLAEAARAADLGAQHTARITQTDSGRSAYVPSANLAEVEDPGARAVAIILNAMAEGMR